MHQIDLKAEITRLRQLGSDFKAMHSNIRSLALKLGTYARRQITSHITTSAPPTASSR
jgi:hypothetical protein